MAEKKRATGGRGASHNPANRFDGIAYVRDEAVEEEPEPLPRTRFLPDASRTIIARNDSPDIPFDASINPYRGCEHGCIYCYARPTHEYLGFSAGLDFESVILVKERAPELLRAELASPKWKPQPLAMSGVTDPYQPVERRLRLTRRCLEVLAECRNPVTMITKNRLITRDIDCLSALAQHRAASVFLSVTTLDLPLNRVLEPRTSLPSQRLAAIEALAQAGVPVGVLVAPVIPGLTDAEIPAILEAAARAGASYAGYVMLRLPHAVLPLFEEWLGTYFPDRAEKVMNRIREVRGGKPTENEFGKRMRGEGRYADHIDGLFRVARRRAGLSEHAPELSCQAFRRPSDGQLDLFG